jgi:hypothetical protein
MKLLLVEISLRAQAGGRKLMQLMRETVRTCSGEATNLIADS